MPVRPCDSCLLQPGTDRSRVRRLICRFRDRPLACLSAAALVFGPITAKKGSPIYRLRRLNTPSERRPPKVSVFDAIDTR